MSMQKEIKISLFYAFLAVFVLFSSSFAQNSIMLTDVEPGYVDYSAFNLTDDATVTVSGKVGGFKQWGNKTYFYGWILNADSRNLVWHLLDNRDIREQLDDLEFVEFDEKVELPAGNYEVYFTGGSTNFGEEIHGLGDLLDKIFGDDKKEFRRRYRDDLYLSLTGPSNNLKVVDKNKFADDLTKGAVVSMIRVGDDEYIKKPFALKQETTLRVYALGEGTRDRIYDYAWIYDASTYEKVWQMKPRTSEYAGGADKNLMVDEDVTLPAGNYYAVYVSDDSHSFEEWNQMPPDDPQFYGLTIWAASDKDAANVTSFDESKVNEPFVEIIKVGDNQFRKKGFTLKKDLEILIHAFGEGYDKRRLSDFGWIVNADDGTKVWNMESANIEYGGGAEKNRMVHEKIKLKAGNYIVYYQTDGSHSYERWNDAPPYDPEKWGITLWTVNPDDKKYVETFDPDNFQSEKVIAQIVRVRNDEYESKTFTIEKTKQVRILAIGEGSDGRMYDYGWIENADNGQIIWEMTYRKTDYAGGARKNRKFDGTITLAPGTYKLYYESDDSHAFRDWNSTPPYNQEMYGISVFNVD